jgi:hypothetical protein
MGSLIVNNCISNFILNQDPKLQFYYQSFILGNIFFALSEITPT